MPEFNVLANQFESRLSISRHSVDKTTGAYIYKKVPLLRVLNIDFERSFLDFIEDEARIDDLIDRFAKFNDDWFSNGIICYTRSPIGSGLNVELRIVPRSDLKELLSTHRVTPSVADKICGLHDIKPFRILSLGKNFLVGFVDGQGDGAKEFAETVVRFFPALNEHFSDCMPDSVDVAVVVANDLNTTGTFYIKW